MTRIEKHNAKIMKEAGFKATHFLYNTTLWRRGQIAIATGKTESVTLKQLVRWVANSSYSYLRSVTSINFPDEDKLV